MGQRTVYTKYQEKMKRLICENTQNGVAFISDDCLGEYKQYFQKTLKKEEHFFLYRYSPTWYKNGAERILALDFDNLYCKVNGGQNDIFEGLPFSDYDTYSVEECVENLGRIGAVNKQP